MVKTFLRDLPGPVVREIVLELPTETVKSVGRRMPGLTRLLTRLNPLGPLQRSPGYMALVDKEIGAFAFSTDDLTSLSSTAGTEDWLLPQSVHEFAGAGSKRKGGT